MSDMWELVSDAGSPLLAPIDTAAQYRLGNDTYAWNVCPIDNSPNYACFHLPGVTDATSSSNFSGN